MRWRCGAKQTSKGLVFGAVVRCWAVVLSKDKVKDRVQRFGAWFGAVLVYTNKQGISACLVLCGGAMRWC
jgi:hypothetical protein